MTQEQEAANNLIPTEATSTSKKFLVRNTITNIVFAAFNAITTLYFVRYQIRNLEMANYGIIILASSFLSYVQVFTIAITGAVGRFVTLHASRKEYSQANSYLSTQVVTTAVLIAVMLPILGVISYLSPRFLNIPNGQEANAQILFFLVFASFMIALATSIFKTCIFVTQRFDIGNYLEMLNQVVRYSTWIMMFSILVPCIWQVGTGYVLGASVTLAAHVIVFRKLTPQLRARLSGFDKRKFAEMFKMGIWMSLSQVGMMLYLGVDALIINKVFGSESVGKYGTIAGISLQMQALSGFMMYLLATPAIACYAKQEWAQLMDHLVRAVKFMSLGFAIGLGTICGLAAPFILWWLGPKYGSLNLLVWILIPHLVLNLGMTPIYAVTYATNKMLAPGLATLAGGLVKVALALTLIRYTTWGIVGLAVADLIAVSLKNMVFAPLYAGHILKGNSLRMYAAVAPSVLVFTATAATGWQLSRMFNLATVPRLAVAGMALMIVFGIVTYFLALNKDDKRLLKQVVPWGTKA